MNDLNSLVEGLTELPKGSTRRVHTTANHAISHEQGGLLMQAGYDMGARRMEDRLSKIAALARDAQKAYPGSGSIAAIIDLCKQP
jgi:hypothetical protein